jgi:beta-xylosidase
MTVMAYRLSLGLAMIGLSLAGCAATTTTDAASAQAPAAAPTREYLTQPLVASLYTADPSAHVFDGKIYVYASHDIEEGPPLADVEPFLNSEGNAFKMRDYVVLSMDHPQGKVEVHRNVLDIANVPWAARQMWAPDAAFRNGTYYLYFPAKDRAGAFRIGVATAKQPAGPFTARPEPIKGSYSIDPSVFIDDDGSAYMYFGGINGGQLQRNIGGVYNPNGPGQDTKAPGEQAFMPQVAKLRDDMIEYAEKPRDALIVDEAGKPLRAGDAPRRFFEGSWMHKYDGKYYLSYSTGGTHFIAYAIGESPYGPFTYKGNVLLPVTGWTTHHSIIEHGGRWWLYYADDQMSGKTYLRNVKVTELFYNPDGTIRTIDPMVRR